MLFGKNKKENSNIKFPIKTPYVNVKKSIFSQYFFASKYATN